MKRTATTPTKKSTGTYKQFAIRLDENMSFELQAMSIKTNIPKTIISRIALQQLMNDWKITGVIEKLEKACSIN